MKTLESAQTNNRLKAEDSAKAIGLYVQATGRDFIFFSHFIMEVLISCNIACKILQSSKENINSTMTLISCVREELQAKREIYTQDKVEAIISNVIETGGQQQQSGQQRGKRKRFITSRLEDFLVTTWPRLHRVAILCIDLMEEEFSRRFSRENTQLWASMECLLPSSPNFMDIKQLEPFYEYCVSIPVVCHQLLSQELMKADFEAECRIYRRIISKQDPETFQHRIYFINKF